jgi:hypothetical protein
MQIIKLKNNNNKIKKKKTYTFILNIELNRKERKKNFFKTTKK